MLNLQADSSERDQINKIKNGKGVTTNITKTNDHKRLLYEQSYGNKMDNVEKKGQIPRNVQSLTMESGRNRKHEQTNYQE